MEKRKAEDDDKQQAKRTRNKTRPPLSRAVCTVMVEYLLEEKKPEEERLPWFAWLDILKETDFPQFVKGISHKKRFQLWIESLDVREKEGKHVLCLKGSGKLVPCREDFSRIIREAHREMGEFTPNRIETANQKGRTKIVHNQVDKCLRLIQAKYAFGTRLFGIRKLHVYKEVLSCPECFINGKLKVPANEIINAVEMIDPDFGNENNFISIKDAPMCMAIKGPSDDSVWYDQEGLATEGNLYQKLLGVIHEIGYELGQCVQNNEVARERLMTKICCAEKLVSDIKKEVEPVFTYIVSSDTFLNDYSELEKEYVDSGKLGVLLYDINLLINTYRKYENQQFLDKLNASLDHHMKNVPRGLRISMDKRGMLLEGLKRKQNKTKTQKTKTYTEIIQTV